MATAVVAMAGISVACPVIAAAGPAPSPSPSPSSNAQACNSSTEFYIQFDPITCASNAAGAVATWASDQAIQSVANWITTAAASGSASLLGQLNQQATHPELNAAWFNSVY